MDFFFLVGVIIVIIIVYRLCFYKDGVKNIKEGKSPALVVFALLSVGVILTIVPYLFAHHSLIGIDASAGTIGDAINGMTAPFITFAGVVVTFYAFWIQYQANISQTKQFKKQSDDYRRERIETNFFELIKFHRENVSELTYTTYQNKEKHDKGQKDTATGRKVFNEIFEQFKDLYEELKPFYLSKEEDIYEPKYLSLLKQNKRLVDNNKSISFIDLAILDIVYLIIFFGADNEELSTIKNFLAAKYKSSFYSPMLTWASIKPKKEDDKNWAKWTWFRDTANEPALQKEVFKDLEKLSKNPTKPSQTDHLFGFDEKLYIDNYYFDNKFERYYGGHQFRLGHYYRNLFQAVNYIHREEKIKSADKYKYVKMLRAQLSTFEQCFLFLNSLSQLGRIWELGDKKNPQITIEEENQLITRYELIRNVPSNTIVDTIQYSDFYPYIDYEGFTVNSVTINKERARLNAVYEKKDHTSDS